MQIHIVKFQEEDSDSYRDLDRTALCNTDKSEHMVITMPPYDVNQLNAVEAFT